MKIMKRLPVLAMILAMIWLCGCVRTSPMAATASGTPSPMPASSWPPTPKLPQTPKPTPLPPDAAFESSAPPLSEADFTLILSGGEFCLLNQGASELEALTGEAFSDDKLQTGEFLFTKFGSYVNSVFFLSAPTPRKISPGASLDAVLEAYGTPSEIDDFGSSKSYVYYLPQNGGDDGDDGDDFEASRPLWYYAVGFSVSDDIVEQAFIADWTTE